MKNITFKEKLNLFLKSKANGIPHYAHSRISLRMQLSACVCRLDLVHALLSTSSGIIPNPFFHTISSLTWYIFKRHENPTGND